MTNAERAVPGMSIQEQEVHWYLRFGKYPQRRMRRDSHGQEYVIGDFSWNNAPGNPHEMIEAYMRDAGITS